MGIWVIFDIGKLVGRKEAPDDFFTKRATNPSTTAPLPPPHQNDLNK